MITAHSGCDTTPDNSMEYLSYALTLAIDALEIDVRRNKNQQLILSHDPTTGHAVLLSEVFELLRNYPDKKVNCDLKLLDLEDDVVSLAREYQVENQLIFTGDTNANLFHKEHLVYPEVEWYANIECFHPDYEDICRTFSSDEEKRLWLENVLLEVRDYQLAGLNCDYHDAELIWEKAKELGIGLSVWTVDAPEEQKLWLQRKVANITTRNTKQILDLLPTISS